MSDGEDELTQTLQPVMATNEPAQVGQVPAASPVVQAGQVHAGRYRLEQQLAQRGGTLTWRAFDQKLSRSVLVHVLAHDDPRTSRVLESARKAAFATDSRFLRVLDAVVGEQTADPSLVVCEFAPGESLERLLRQGPLSALEAAWVARELADAMQSMHAEGLFHQRINPDTVIITATGNVKIVGLLIEAAMYPQPGDETLAWSELEQGDVTAIGQVLYASLVARWPVAGDVGEDGHPVRTWGLLPAPTDEHGWLTPRQVRAGVSPALDEICDQVLSAQPRRQQMPLRTANQLAKALTQVLGSADAAADLERRMRYPVAPQAEEDTGPLAETAVGMAAVGHNDGATVLSPAVGAVAAAPVAAWSSAGPLSRDENRTPSSPSTPSTPAPSTPAPNDKDTNDKDTNDKSSNDQGSGGRSASGKVSEGKVPEGRAAVAVTQRMHSHRPQQWRWRWVLVALVVLAILGGLLRLVLGGSDGDGRAAGKQPEAVEIVAVEDFDPTADGGNGEENPGQLARAHDGDPATAWQTLVYLNSAQMGRLKPGVGLVLDLGERRDVSGVKVTLQGQPTGVELRVPADPSVSTAPMAGIDGWSRVAANPKAGTSVELRPEQAVQSRFVMVYLTSLPSVGNNRYRGAVAEVEVLS
ncbi:protein kinase family protein [Luteococcus sp.]|uniref:protein kinase family protein n=1 Tax=Luteococcus sp. TaxID=1969402 RepID=UPI003734EC30